MQITLEKMEGGKVVQNVLKSNDVAYIKYFAGIFNEVWGMGIDAVNRIKDIEEESETDYELADAKEYLNQVILEIDNMGTNAENSAYRPNSIRKHNADRAYRREHKRTRLSRSSRHRLKSKFLDSQDSTDGGSNNNMHIR